MGQKTGITGGIINGSTNSIFSPDGGRTRAQIVTFLWLLYAGK